MSALVGEETSTRVENDPRWANPEAARQALCDQLEAEGAQWVGIINAATAQLAGVIARALQSDAWFGFGINSPQHWAGLRFGLASQRAKRLVDIAAALPGLPTARSAFHAGVLSEDLMSVIVRANPSIDDEAAVTELAHHTTVGQLRHALRGVPQAPSPDSEPTGTKPTAGDGDGQDGEQQGNDDEQTNGRRGSGPEPAPERPEPVRDRSSVSSWFDDDERWQLRANLDPTDGAIVEKALRAAGDRLFNNHYGDDADPALRNKISTVDALMLLCQIGLDAFDPATRNSPGRTPSERFVVNLHVNADRPETGRLHLGPLLPNHLRQEATCDALRRLWLEDDCGNVNLGRTARVVDAKLRTVLEVRDGCCQYPGCGRSRGLIAHHIEHWEDGGLTNTENLVLLCGEHHRAVHRHEFHISGNADRQLAFTDPSGRRLGPLPPQSPDGPIDKVAANAGMPKPQWQNRSGEHGQWDNLFWSDTNPPHPSRNRSSCSHNGEECPDHWPKVWPDPWPDPWSTTSWSGDS